MKPGVVLVVAPLCFRDHAGTVKKMLAVKLQEIHKELPL